MNDDILKSLRLIEGANAKDLKDLTPLTESIMQESPAGKIVGNEIHYADHVVTCDASVASPEYMQDMLDSLSPDGDAAQHEQELEDMNNDGSWTVTAAMNEVSDEKVYKHKGSYGTSYDGDDDEKKAAPAEKRGRGRPRKGADNSGEVKKYDWSAFGGKVKLPAHKGTVTKHKIDDPKPKAKKVDEVSDAKVYRHTGSYGTSYDGNDDAKAPEVKRGRGRPRKGADNSGEVKKYDFSAFTKKAPVGKHTGAITKHKMVGESTDGVIGAITNRIMRQRMDLLSQYGPEAVMAAIEDVAQSYGDLEEIGSSDVSAMIKSVEASLGHQGEQVNELSKDTLKSYANKATTGLRSSARHAFDSGRTMSSDGKASEKSFNKAINRGKGVQGAITRMTKEDAGSFADHPEVKDLQDAIDGTMAEIESRLEMGHSVGSDLDRDLENLERQKRELIDNLSGKTATYESEQLNEYLVQEGGSIDTVLALNVFEDLSSDDGLAAHYEDFANSEEWKALVEELSPKLDWLEAGITRLAKAGHTLSEEEVEMVHNVWYDGSDAYEDAMVDELAQMYGTQIEIVEEIMNNHAELNEAQLKRAMAVIKEAIVLEKKMTAKDKSKREEIVKGMKKDTKGFAKRYGKKAKDVMYATATKQAMKEAANPVLYVAESAFRKIAAMFESVDMLSAETQDALYDGSIDIEDALTSGEGLRAGEQEALKDMYNTVANENGLHPDDDFEQIYDLMMGEIEDAVINGEVEEGADLLKQRIGPNMVNKKPRAGQTKMGNIPAGNLPGSKNRYTADDRARQPGQLKTSIKGALGKHGPKGILPEAKSTPDQWKQERLKGCTCKGPLKRDVNSKCPIHGTVQEAKADPVGSWVAHKDGKAKKFKTYAGAKAFAAKNDGYKVASIEGYAKLKTEKVKEAAKPDFLDVDKDGDKKEPMKKAITDKKKMVKENLDMGVGVQSPMMGAPAAPEKIDLSANMLIDLLKLAGLGGNMMTPYAPAAPAVVPAMAALPEPEMDMGADLPDEIPMDEEYANAPNEEYGELDDIITNGDDLHKEKGTFPKVNGGDNPRQSSVFEGLWAQYQAAKAKVK